MRAEPAILVQGSALGEAIEQQGVLMCETYADGLVVLTTSFKLYALHSFTHRQLVPLAVRGVGLSLIHI